MLVLLSRLGLRAGEVAAFQLSDVGWRDGTLRVHGKGSRIDVLPLPADAGEAIADYVRAGGPRRGRAAVPPDRRTARRPGANFGVTSIVYRACERAGLPRPGRTGSATRPPPRCSAAARRCRRSPRCCGTASMATTAIYAKADRQALAALALPWPGGAA